MSDDIDDDDDDWCEHCGSIECKGECLKVPVGESPGARLERIATAERDKLHKATQALLQEKLFPESPPPLKHETLEDFERSLQRRAKLEVARRADGTTYRKRVP